MSDHESCVHFEATVIGADLETSSLSFRMSGVSSPRVGTKRSNENGDSEALLNESKRQNLSDSSQAFGRAIMQITLSSGSLN
jgi:hypothetical protein